MRIWAIIVLMTGVLITTGCDTESEKTDSMLYREAAIRDAQKPLKKALLMLDQEIKSEPKEHLDMLLIVQNAMNDSRQIYEKSNIVNFEDEKLSELENYFIALQPQLVEFASELLISVVNRTELLRTQIEEAKTQPYSARGNDTSQLVDFLGQKYNEDVKKCCLHKLSQIDQLLKHEASQYRELLILIRSINTELGNVIKEKGYATKLKKRILLANPNPG